MEPQRFFCGPMRVLVGCRPTKQSSGTAGMLPKRAGGRAGGADFQHHNHEGIGASQLGIGMVSARIAEIIRCDEQAVIPIRVFNPKSGVTLSMPRILGRVGVSRILEPTMAEQELQGLRRSAEKLQACASSNLNRPGIIGDMNPAGVACADGDAAPIGLWGGPQRTPNVDRTSVGDGCAASPNRGARAQRYAPSVFPL
jgi:hypothetical protein